MRKAAFAVLGILIVVAGAAWLQAQDKSKIALKPGDEIFACNCGPECDCQTLSRKEGSCACGNALAKAKVKSVGKGTAVLVIGDREQTFKTVGKYMCACGPECKCDTISQKPGKCACGVDMVEVKK
ncbi:MAG TPA: hypothetical protein VLJ16_13525 [Acidobacteriota bacterium]|nr:hypothetical protein [Acidobacteriota bacterium]